MGWQRAGVQLAEIAQLVAEMEEAEAEHWLLLLARVEAAVQDSQTSSYSDS